VSLDPADIRVGTSFDQILSQRIGGQTAVPSLALGIEPNELRLEDGLSMIYGSCILVGDAIAAWRPRNTYPARTFDLLVGDGTGRKVDRSILDAVRQEALDPAAENQWRRPDQAERVPRSIRDIEKRIERAAKDERLEGWRPTLDKPNMERPAALPQDVPSSELMPDLMVLAFQMDKTRIITPTHAEQRPVADEFPVCRRRQGRAART
jgi:hypothetical protein